MGIELSGAGEALTAIVVSDELSKQHSGNHDDQNPDVHKNCANCGVQLTGAFCHACGQSAHIHRSLLHMVEEALHGIFHFDTKAWRTIPALIFKPGHLTKQYIEGKRTSFVSPLALFLFLIFLMFFIFSYTTIGPSNDMLHIPSSREDVMKELSKAEVKLNQQLAEQAKQGTSSPDAFELREEISDIQFEVRKLKDTLNKIDGKEKDLPALKKELALAEANLNSLREAKLKLKLAARKANSTDTASSASASDNANTDSSTETNSASKSAQDQDSQAENANNASSHADARKANEESIASPTAPMPMAKLQPWEITQSIRLTEREVKYLKKQVATGDRDQAQEQEKAQLKTALKKMKNDGSSAASASADIKANPNNANDEKTSEDVDGTNINFKNSSAIPYFGDMIEHATKNPELTLFKMKKNASGLAFLLVPLTLPFLWLLFAFKRKFVMFDHAVFALYSLSFMCLLLSTIAIVAYFEFNFIAAMLFSFVPPIHMFAQLRHAYSLSIFSTFWRTIALLFIAMLSLSLFAAIVTIASA